MALTLWRQNARRLCPSTSARESGVGLIEALVGIVLVVLASIATLTFFSYGVRHIRKQGVRRAALEIARQRMEQMMETGISNIAGSDSNSITTYRVTCTGTPCTWGFVADDPSLAPETVVITVPPVGTLTAQMISTAQRVNDPSTSTAKPDALDLSVKVWYTNRTGNNDDYNRVVLRTLRSLI